jgi:large subunit ribosomal protein L9
MKVILIQDVNNLGEEGDIKEVAPGYARNFLIPQKKALVHTAQNLNILQQKKASIDRRKAEKKEIARSLKEKLAEAMVTLSMPAGDKGRLYGAVTSTMIADEIEKLGLHIEKKKVELHEQIKTVGKYKAHIKLYGGESVDVQFEVKGTGRDG